VPPGKKTIFIPLQNWAPEGTAAPLALALVDAVPDCDGFDPFFPLLHAATTSPTTAIAAPTRQAAGQPLPLIVRLLLP
jgi:hypothetical protein